MNWFRKMMGHVPKIIPDQGLSSSEPPDSHYHLVRQAWQEWKDARQHFNQVSDPDMIDYAIYSWQAAERRYMYLLQKVRQETLASSRKVVPPEK